MKSLQKILLGTTMALGFGIFGTTVLADTLYTVKSGDTLSTISQSITGDNSLINSIAKDNNIKNIDLIHVGQELNIKTDGQAVAAPTNYVEPTYQEETYTEPANQETYSAPAETSSYTGNSSSAKEWIAQRESSGSYSATNGQYIGRYQLSSSYLNGDYSPENQERVADQYVADRYGSWENAQSFWMNNGWY
ncbi:LysM peptidoglycan-binding domain-containing protein [Vagococcus sp. DIV0080]|uniref:LysM peptidoglycan-binding domain-containing protein n=1 Tax=Candidatus Vagococcus giribetii TaxID=2230876 RepID=A0ABS3HQ40_9ENTE|nr:LysM domain-containing protein [Vagococcus sp. DIV0080]MBO0475872.1 LysM peptidoglycan-binding domain-containing protein [Vagococcus sp. DIV0080]